MEYNLKSSNMTCGCEIFKKRIIYTNSSIQKIALLRRRERLDKNRVISNAWYKKKVYSVNLKKKKKTNRLVKQPTRTIVYTYYNYNH